MSEPAVSFDDVAVRFGSYDALRRVSFDVDPGGFVAIIGPNGAGKSTLLNVLLGVQAFSAGSIKVFGGPPSAFPPGDLGYVPQLKTLDRSFPAVALELVVTGLRRGWPWRIRAEERATAMRALERCGVGHAAKRSIAALSGGELQRVYLARSLVRPARLLILDEPAAGMDVSGEADMYHLLDDYQGETGATILMVTHDWEGARVHASDVLLLNRGVAAYGPSAEVATEARLMDAF
ncbi:MAG: metal ABC transporter ATP-binding protein, partial [Candidatus Hydrogenedentes bacterium]|nr:metal ABC transporter ATP-binding protein [Candidatus Hydrogenedentota bacterium]